MKLMIIDKNEIEVLFWRRKTLEGRFFLITFPALSNNECWCQPHLVSLVVLLR